MAIILFFIVFFGEMEAINCMKILKLGSVLLVLLTMAVAVGPQIKNGEAASLLSTQLNSPQGNLVEPLSNGLLLSMTKSDIIERFGPPTYVTWDDGTFGYRDFTVICGGKNKSIWHLTLKENIKLNSGIGIGSGMNEVMKTFNHKYDFIYDQYHLIFSYAGDQVSGIKIDPVNDGFAPYSGKGSAAAQATVGRSAFVGLWYGTASTVGTIDIRPDGTYVYNGNGNGTYAVNGNIITFTGPLSAWDGGRATLDGGNLVFYWRNKNGSKNWFTFAKE
ncbi:MAG TPA: hypothetical protein V6D00_11495 [Pantanalinema sp.]